MHVRTGAASNAPGARSRCNRLVRVSVSHPLNGSPSQLPNPAVHAPITHEPVEQVPVAIENVHGRAHSPQCVRLDRVSVSHPLAGSWSQSPEPRGPPSGTTEPGHPVICSAVQRSNRVTGSSRKPTPRCIARVGNSRPCHVIAKSSFVTQLRRNPGTSSRARRSASLVFCPSRVPVCSDRTGCSSPGDPCSLFEKRRADDRSDSSVSYRSPRRAAHPLHSMREGSMAPPTWPT